MPDYDFDMDFSPESSVGMIFQKVSKDSVVLEFGCANGRMTRALKHVLGCKVYIVEYDEKAFSEAVNYAEDGVCEDILLFSWAEKFKDIRFDAIIFADVLEHLAEPEKALEKAATLLGDEGSIFISIPNVTHNDILIKASQESFEYMDSGLLDRTHVHFWGKNDLESLADCCGLSLARVEATYCETGSTEQLAGKCAELPPRIVNALIQRDCGEVYQYIITLNKGKGEVTEQDDIFCIENRGINSYIYLDTGNDFNGKEIIKFRSRKIGEDKYNAHYVISGVKGLKRLRFDPVEKQSCIIKRISIVQGEQKVETAFSDHIVVRDDRVFLNDDPYVLSDKLKDESTVIVDADFVVGEKYYDAIVEGVRNAVNRMTELSKELEEKTTQVLKLKEITEENEELSKRINAYKKDLKDLKGKCIEFEKNVDEYSERIKSLEQEREAKGMQEYLLRTLISKKEALLIEREREIEMYKNSRYMRFRRKMKELLKKA